MSRLKRKCAGGGGPSGSRTRWDRRIERADLIYHAVVAVGQRSGRRLARSGEDQVACGMSSTSARRRQPQITIRSEKAVARLALLTRDGRSRVQVIAASRFFVFL